jgi:hypothetical protein
LPGATKVRVWLALATVKLTDTLGAGA